MRVWVEHSGAPFVAIVIDLGARVEAFVGETVKWSLMRLCRQPSLSSQDHRTRSRASRATP